MNSGKIQVAVVDDDESFARALGRLLRAAGCEITTYSSAEAFLVQTTVPKLDCLVIDIQLGSMSGLDLLRQLRKTGNLTPVIFVTAHDAPEVREEAQQAGCVAYLRKPVPGRSLLEALGRAVDPGG